MIDPNYPNISKAMEESWAIINCISDPTDKMIEHCYQICNVFGAYKIYHKTNDVVIKTYLVMKYSEILNPDEELNHLIHKDLDYSLKTIEWCLFHRYLL